METPKIAGKVKFWEEQDRINKELIPRVLKQHELLTAHVEHHTHADPEARVQIKMLQQETAAQMKTLEESAMSRIGTLEESAAAVRSAKRQSLVVSFVSLAVAIAAIVLALS